MIQQKDIRQAAETLQEYKRAKAALEARVIENEQWFKMRHWKQYRRSDGGKLPNSGWLFNAILNKHADAMEQYPEPAVLPCEESDAQSAKVLSQIVPAILEKNHYEQIYSDAWWYKLKQGTSVKAVYWDAAANDIAIKRIDLLNLFWEPGITDLQQSQNIFNVELYATDKLKRMYPQAEFLRGGHTIDVSKYIYDESIDTADKTAVIDWYYKRKNASGKEVLHYCKFAGDTILYASENEPAYAHCGYYDHGLYPFVADVLFVEEGMPVGFGLIDALKDTQEAIDELDSDILFQTRLRAKPRYLAKAGSGVNLSQLGDYTKDFIEVTGDPTQSVFRLPVEQIDGAVVEYRNLKINELKEIAGNRDFNQGWVAGGVTAASAIAALQESGSKLSRDAIKASYRAFVEECSLVIELIRQFYDATRVFRITEPNGAYSFIEFNNSAMKPYSLGTFMGIELGAREPIFDIRVSAQKQSPFNQISHNQLILELFEKGFFNPALSDQAAQAVSMMAFEGKEKLMSYFSQPAQAGESAESEESHDTGQL